MAGRPKGLPKTGGRKKGTPNKNSVLLGEALKTFAFDPVARLIKIYDTLTTDLQVRVCLAFIDHVYPKTKATALDEGGSDGPTEQEVAAAHRAVVAAIKNERK